MKKVILSFALLLGGMTTALSQEAPKEMVTVLQKTYSSIDTTMDMAVITPLSKKLELVAEKYSTQWLAQYYAALSKVMLSYMEPDATKKDMLIDEAEKYMEVIRGLKIENDERYILEAYIANGRLAVDGEKRWMKYGPI